MEGSPSVVSVAIVILILISIVSWLTSTEVQDWLQNKYYKFRMWCIKRKNKRNKWKWGDEIEWE